MVTNPILFTKSNNVYKEPNNSWNLTTKIYVKGTVNLGLDNLIIFNQDNPIKLDKLIRINSALIGQEREFVSSIKGYRDSITIETIAYNELKIYQGLEKNELLVHYRKWTGEIASKCNCKILSQLESTPKELCNKYILRMRMISSDQHELLKSTYNFKFDIGDKIEYNSQNSSKKGLVYGLNYHGKENYIYYTVFCEGEIKKRRLLENEIRQITSYDQGITPSS